MSDLFGGVTSEQAAAGVSAMTCPTHHSNAVPVETLDGQRIATLCPDCDRQLPADWRTPAERAGEMERDHRKDHHGYWSIFKPACRLCAEERDPNLTG